MFSILYAVLALVVCVQAEDLSSSSDVESCATIVLYNSTYRYRLTETDDDCDFNEGVVRCLNALDKNGSPTGDDWPFNGTVTTDHSTIKESFNLFPTYLFDKRHYQGHDYDQVTIRRTFDPQETDNQDDREAFEKTLLVCGERNFLLGERHDSNSASSLFNPWKVIAELA